MANEAAQALQNSVVLQQLFENATSPTANFFAENRKLAIEKEKYNIMQRNRLAEISLQHQYAEQEQAQRQAAAQRSQTQSEAAALGLTREQNQAVAAREHANALLNQSFLIAQQERQAAEAIRSNPNSRKYLPKISSYKDDAEGNKKLIADFHAGVAANGEKVDTEEAAELTSKSISIVKQLANTSAGSPQAKLAIQQYFAQPGVADTFVRKGKFTPEQIQALVASGDPAAVYQAIAKVGEEASWIYGSDNKVVSNLTAAWMEALGNTKALSPDQQVQADLLKTYLTRRDAIFAQGNISSPQALEAVATAAGLSSKKAQSSVSDILKARDALNKPVIPQAVAPQEVGLRNPFGQVPVPPPSGRLGLADALTPTPVNQAVNSAYSGVGSPIVTPVSVQDTSALAFTPQRLAQDPATEYAARKQLLDKSYQQTAATAALQAGLSLGFSNSSAPTDAMYEQAKKENALKGLVMSLYNTPRIDVQDPVSVAPVQQDPVQAAPYPTFGPKGPF